VASEMLSERTDLPIAVICGCGLEEVWKCGFERVEGAKDVDVHDGFECVRGQLCYGHKEVACCACSVWSVMLASFSVSSPYFS